MKAGAFHGRRHSAIAEHINWHINFNTYSTPLPFAGMLNKYVTIRL